MSLSTLLHNLLYYVGVAETSILLYLLLQAALVLAIVPRLGMQRKQRIVVVTSAAVGTACAFIVNDRYDSYSNARSELPIFATVLAGLVVVACFVTWVFFQKNLRLRRPGVRILSSMAGYASIAASLSVFAYMVDIQVMRDIAMYGSALDSVLLDTFIFARDLAFITAFSFIIASIVVMIRAYGRRQFQEGVAFGRNNPKFIDIANSASTLDHQVQVTTPTSQWARQDLQS